VPLPAFATAVPRRTGEGRRGRAIGSDGDGGDKMRGLSDVVISDVGFWSAPGRSVWPGLRLGSASGGSTSVRRGGPGGRRGQRPRNPARGAGSALGTGVGQGRPSHGLQRPDPRAGDSGQRRRVCASCLHQRPREPTTIHWHGVAARLRPRRAEPKCSGDRGSPGSSSPTKRSCLNIA
jgi:hypothetical protein